MRIVRRRVRDLKEAYIDPRGRLTVTAGSDRPSVHTFQNIAKQNKVPARIAIATGGTVVWPSGSLYDSSLVFIFSVQVFPSLYFCQDDGNC